MSGNIGIKIRQILGNRILWVRRYRFLGIISNIFLVPIFVEMSGDSGKRAMRSIALLHLEEMMSMWHFTFDQVKLDNCKEAFSSRREHFTFATGPIPRLLFSDGQIQKAREIML